MRKQVTGSFPQPKAYGINSAFGATANADFIPFPFGALPSAAGFFMLSFFPFFLFQDNFSQLKI
jgi:hypothetical protein